jgi:hypothetical protein
MKPIRKNFPDGPEGMKQFQKAMKIYTARMMAKGLGIKSKTTKSPGSLTREDATNTKFNKMNENRAKSKSIGNKRKPY